jgi:cytochrome b
MWRRVPVWDLPTRLFHWLVVILVAAAYMTWRLDWMEWHAGAGDALLALLLWRLLWGFFGSETARFRYFLASPVAAARHLAHVARREPDLVPGHNPAGGWMVLVLLALLLGQTISGIYVDNDVANDGPLTGLVPARIADMITTAHALLWDALMAAAAVHVLAIVVYAAAKRQNLLLPMVTGRKWLPPTLPAPRMTGPGRALFALGLAAAAAAAAANLL